MSDKSSRLDIKENFELALLRLQDGKPTKIDKDAPITLENVAKEAKISLETIKENATLLSVNVGIVKLYEALDRFKTNTMINVPLWNKLTIRSLSLEAGVLYNFINIHKKDGTLALPKLLDAIDDVIKNGYIQTEQPDLTVEEYEAAMNRILKMKCENLPNTTQLEVNYANIAAEVGKKVAAVRSRFNQSPELQALLEKNHSKQRSIFPTTLDKLEDALERLIKNKPINVPKNQPITNSLVSVEAGFDKSTIRPNRKRYEKIIKQIEEAEANRKK